MRHDLQLPELLYAKLWTRICEQDRIMLKLISGSLLFAVIFLVSSSMAAQEWREVATPGAVIITDAREGQARETALRFEQLRFLFGEIFRRPQTHTAAPLKIIIATPEHLASEPALSSVVRRLPAAACSPDGDVILIDSTVASAISSASALYANRLLEYNYPPTQPWFDLGIEELFSTANIRSKEMQFGGPHPNLPPQTQWIPLVELFSAKLSKPLSGTVTITDLRSTTSLNSEAFAAESLTFIRWLIAKQRMEDAGKYLGLVMARGETVEAAIQEAFGMPPAQLDAELQAFARIQPAPQNIPLQDTVQKTHLPLRKLSALDARAVLADAALQFADNPSSLIAELDPLVKQNPTNAGLHRALAIAYFRRNDTTNAMEHVRRAIELDDADARMHLFYSMYLNNGVRDRIAADNAEMRMSGELKNALRLAPEYAAAHHLYGLALSAAEKHPQAVSELRTATALAPRNERYRLSLAGAYASAGDTKNAEKLLRLLANSSEPGIAAAAKQQISQLGNEQRQERQWAEIRMRNQDPTAPQWKAQNGIGVIPDDDQPKQPDEVADSRPIKFMKGQIVQVDCSDDPAAMIDFRVNNVLWRMRSANYTRTLLIGSERFDCNWKNQHAAINFKPSGAHAGDIVSIEIQP